MTALFGGSVEIRTPSLLRAKQLLISDRAPDPLVLSAGEITCLVYSIFKVLSICGQKKKGLALARPSAWLLFLALRTEPRSNPGGLAMRQPIGVNGCLARTGFGRTLAQADHRHLGGNRKVRGEH